MNKSPLLYFIFLMLLIFSSSSINYLHAQINADLRYMDVSITSGSNEINAENDYTFNNADVGKLIAIKKGHHNPANNADIPYTTPGRIVTVTAIITAVSTDGSSATINGISPNQSGNTRAYIYTNNFETLQNLMFSGVTSINLLQDGIIGVNPFFDSNGSLPETSVKALMFPSTNTLSIQNSGNSRIKLCAENINWDISFALFGAPVSNHNITINASCIPPDEATTRWGGQCSFFSTKMLSENIGAGDSVRTIELKNTTPLTNDIDTGTDPFWNLYFNGVRGGLEDGINFQEVFIENNNTDAEIRTKNGGIAQFGGGSQLTITNLKVNYSNHYIGENGRSFTSEGIYTVNDGGRWQFNNFKIEAGILKPINPSKDFSWYDYVAPSRAMGVSIDGGPFYQFDIDEPTFATIQNGHELDISNTSLANGTNHTITIQFHNDDPNLALSSNQVNTFGHPNYVHPDVAFRITNVTSEFGHWRYYSTGNQYLVDANNPSLGEVSASIKPAFSEIHNSNIQGTGLQFQNFGSSNNNQEIANATRGNLKIVGSDIKARLIFGDLELTNTEIDGDHIYLNSMMSNGGNRFEFKTVDVYNSDFISNGDFYDGYLVRFLKEDVLVQFDNTTFGTNYGSEHLFPYVPNGTLHYLNNTDNTNRLPRYDSSITSTYANEFTEESTIIFENCEFAHVDGNSLFSKSFNNGVIREGAKIEFKNFKFRNPIGLGKLIRPYFAPNHKNNGMANIPEGDKLGVYKLNKTGSLPYSFDKSDINAIGARISFSNQHTLANKSASIIVPTFTTNSFGQFFFTTDWANGAYVDGDFTLRVTDNFVRFNPYYSNGNVDNKRSNTTLSNLVLKTSGKRQNGEIIRFKVDSKQNRAIEVEATLDGNPIDKYYVDTDPIGTPGLDGEIVYLEGDDTIFWTHEVSHTNISGDSYTVTPELVDGHTEIETGIYFSIKQELRTETPWENFEFTLTDISGTLHTFTNSSTGFLELLLVFSTDVHPEYVKHFWTFESQNETDNILCYIENRTGKIIFEQALPFELSSSQALTITQDWEVTEHLWIPGPNNPVDCTVDILHDFETAEQDYSDGNDCTMFPSGHFNPVWNTAFPWKATKYHSAYYIVTDETVYNAQGCDYGNLWMFPNGGYNDNPANASATGGENFVMLWGQKQIDAPEYNGITTTINGLTPGQNYEISFQHSPISTSASSGTRQTDQLQYQPLVSFGGSQITNIPVNYQPYSTAVNNQWYATTIIMQATAESEILSLEFPIIPDPTNVVNDGYIGIDNIRITCSDNPITAVANRDSINIETPLKNSLNKQIAIYPNPANDIIHVKLLEASNQIKTIQIFNPQGRLVWEKEKLENNTLNISTLKSGIYFIKVNTINQNSFTKKIIKQ